ncbi:MAG: class I SAM-dependent RNA methyltransferase [Leptospiraceae bacterium]|nr:class I SAM-dependent RNA methyltransferase [Leptospiraceae bacterium]MCP5498318.1 class I SAM-dependent RNA methyltransferase [Leptospiraceae bacterium]
MENREEFQIRIEKVSETFEGSGYLGDKKYSFRYAKENDEVSVYFTGKRKKYPRLTGIQKNSDHSSVRCRHFADCGGCAAQHFPYEEQFRIKTNRLLQVYQEKLNISIKPIPAQLQYGHRGRMDFAVYPGGIIGLREAGNFRRIINIESCEIQSKWANDELKALRKVLEEHKGIELNRKTLEGYLKYITLRKSRFTEDNISIFTFIEPFYDTDVEEKFRETVLASSTARNIVFCYNRTKSEVSAEGKFKVIRGTSFYTEHLMDKKIEIPFDSFFQPNIEGFMPVLEYTNKLIQHSKQKILLDIFCGNGFFSLLFGETFEELYGFDISEAAIERANLNLKKYFPGKNMSFFQSDLLQLKESSFLKEQAEKNSLALLDPPRRGIGDRMIELLNESHLEEIIYISCNPYSQIEDIEKLDNYVALEGILTDPFPHSPHLESAVYLRRRN